MRHVFLQKGTLGVGDASRSLLDDYSVLVMVHYSLLTPHTELVAMSDAKKSMFFSNVPQKIKKVLESVASYNDEGAVKSPGYSCSGVVIATGKKVTRVRVGEFVACAGAGYAYHADMMCVPENLLVRVKDKKFLEPASLITVGTVALQAVRRAQLQLGELICVIGLGLLGQVIVQLAKRAGCTVIGLDVCDDRLASAQRLGADLLLRADHADIPKEIAFYTDQQGADTTFITPEIHTNAIMQQITTITRKKGRIVLVENVDFDFDHTALYAKELDLLVSSSYGPGHGDPLYEQHGHDYPYAHVRWTENRNMQAFIDFVERGQIDVASLITEVVPVQDIDGAFKKIKTKKNVHLIVSYVAHQPDMVKSQSPHRFVPAVKDIVNVGIIGAGIFAQTRLIPVIAKMKRVKIKAIVDADAAMSIRVCRKYDAARALVDDIDLFQDDTVDVVVITSPHTLHADQAVRALQNGKAVFMGKPMVTDFDQLNRLISCIKTNPTIPFCVDYSRSFSPFMQKVKKVIKKRKTPLAIQYRLNAGFIPKEHLIQTNMGAGRIIGEACHIFDLFCYLTDSTPRAVSVEALHAGNTSFFPTDNVSVQISFADGSICSLFYTSLGHKDLGRERMEIFFDSKSVVVNEYDTLIGFGFPKSFDETLNEPDKGHAALLHQFFTQLKSESFVPPIDIERLATVARLTLIVDQLACEGGGTREL